MQDNYDGDRQISSLNGYPNLEYHVKEPVKCFGAGQSCVFYGIEVTENGKIVAHIDELLPDHEQIKEFVRLCNIHHASLIHLPELIYDFFGIECNGSFDTCCTCNII